MTPKERAVGIVWHSGSPCSDLSSTAKDSLVEQIADEIEQAEAAAVVATIERCAQVAEETFNEERLYEGVRNGDNILAAAIRATGNNAGGER